MGSSSHSYFYFIAFCVTTVIVTGALTKLGFFMARKVFKVPENPAQSESYAGGFFILSNLSQRFLVRFAVIALLFVLFNGELLLLLPWALALGLSGYEGFLYALCFVGLWGIGGVYAYKKGAFE